MDSISAVVFDTRLLRESRQMEIDFVDQLDVYHRRPRQWALSSPVIPTRRVDERYSRLCEKELKRSGFWRRVRDVGCVTTEDHVF